MFNVIKPLIFCGKKYQPGETLKTNSGVDVSTLLRAGYIKEAKSEVNNEDVKPLKQNKASK